MRIIKRAARLSLLASALALSLSGAAQAAQFSRTYFFGDSLTDSGAYGARFTTNPGNVWSQYLANYFGTTANPFNQGGTNYAMGGARVTRQDTYSPQAFAVTTQLTNYLGTQSVDADALYFISGGPNDIFYQVGLLGAGAITPAQMQANISTAATDLLAQVTRLHAAGARYIMVANIPDIGATPLQGAQPTAPFGAVTQLFNGTLSAGLNQLGFDVISLDLYNLIREVVANPSAYGFVNAALPACTTESSLTCTPATLRDPNAATTWVFADGVHPTSGMHRVAADYAVSVIEAPEKIGLLAEAPLQVSAAQKRGVTNRMMAGGGEARAKGSASFYGSYDYSTSDIDRGPRTGGADGTANSVLIGGDVKFTDAVTAGLAFGYSGNKTDFANSGGGFKLDETMLTAYGVVGLGAAYLGGAVSYGDLDFKNVNRNIVLGGGMRNESGNTEGSHRAVDLFGGYWMSAGDVKHGPGLGLTHQRVRVKGYSETGANSTTMQFGQQDRDSLIGSLSYTLMTQMNAGGVALKPFARLSYEHEFDDNNRQVRANLVTMGGSFQMPVYQADADNGRVELGLSAQFGKGITAFAGYSATLNSSAGRNQAITLGVQIPM